MRGNTKWWSIEVLGPKSTWLVRQIVLEHFHWWLYLGCFLIKLYKLISYYFLTTSELSRLHKASEGLVWHLAPVCWRHIRSSGLGCWWFGGQHLELVFLKPCLGLRHIWRHIHWACIFPVFQTRNTKSCLFAALSPLAVNKPAAVKMLLFPSIYTFNMWPFDGDFKHSQTHRKLQIKVIPLV